MVTKELIRKNALQERETLTAEVRFDKSDVIMKKLMEMPLYREAEHILTYVSYKSEVETEKVIAHALGTGKQVYCPKVLGEEMEFYRITSMSELTEGYKGIREPKEGREAFSQDKVSLADRNLMIMPGSAFDKEKNRIGYGKGYYDKYMEKHSGLNTAALCFECQIQAHIPADEYDKKPDILITESNIYY